MNMENEELKILRSLIFLLDTNEHGICDFLKNCDLSITKRIGASTITTFYFTFIASPDILKQTMNSHDFYKSKIKSFLHEYHQYNHVIVDLTGDWDKIILTNIGIEAVKTVWDNINDMQKEILNQVLTASTTFNFRNVGNSCRGLLEVLADIVYDEKKHKVSDKHKLSKDKFKNRLWAFINYKFSGISAHENIVTYAESILNASDKGIDLSNDTTHSLNADSFLAQSCAISTITTVHFVKLAFERSDP